MACGGQMDWKIQTRIIKPQTKLFTSGPVVEKDLPHSRHVQRLILVMASTRARIAHIVFRKVPNLDPVLTATIVVVDALFVAGFLT